MAETGTMTLSDLMIATRQRADQLPSGYVPSTSNIYFVSDPELISYINQSYFELYDLLIQKYGNDYYVAPPLQFTTDGINFFYPLPDGTNYSGAPAFYKVMGFDLNLAPNQASGQNLSYITIPPFMFAE